MKDWCHTNNILQVHCWGCLVVQVMFHALMTSLMTSPGHKVGQIFKVTYLDLDLIWIWQLVGRAPGWGITPTGCACYGPGCLLSRLLRDAAESADAMV